MIQRNCLREADITREYVEKGEEMLAKLIILLSEDGRLSDVIKVSQDKEYRQELYVEYHII